MQFMQQNLKLQYLRGEIKAALKLQQKLDGKFEVLGVYLSTRENIALQSDLH